MSDIEHLEYGLAFMDPLQNTWHSQFRRELSKSSGDERLNPSGPMVGVSPKVTGTVQGFVLYYLAADTAARLAEDFGSRPLTPVGDAALGATNDLMNVVMSNALEGMKALSKAIEIKIGDIFECAETGFSGDEEWTFSGRYKPAPDPLSVFGADDIHGFTYLAAMTDSDAPPVPDVPGIIEAAKGTTGGATVGVNANISAAPPMPVPGLDEPREIAELRVTTLKARNLYVKDDQGRKRIVFSAKDDGSATLIFADAEGRMRSTVALSNKGIGRIMFLDRFGKRGFIAPASVKVDKEVRARALRLADRRMETAETVVEETVSEDDAAIREIVIANAFNEPESGAA